MISREFAETFAREWIESWNAHDLDRILSHHSSDFEMTTPMIPLVNGGGSGTLKGHEAVGAYWAKSLQKVPDLHFELNEVFFSVDSITIFYKAVFGLQAVEYLRFGADGKVATAAAHYSSLPVMPRKNG
jgi:hypothetical protein